MTAADKIAEARALIEPLMGHDAGPLRDTRIPSCSGRIIANHDGKHIGSAFGVDNARLFAAAPTLCDTVADLTDLADAMAQENAKLRQRIEQLEGAVMTALVGRAVSETKPCATPSPENAQ